MAAAFAPHLESSSAWTRSDAETIGLFYTDSGPMECDEWKAILRCKIELTGYQSPNFYSQWKRKVKRFCELMEDVHYCHESSTAHQIFQVLARPSPRPVRRVQQCSTSESNFESDRPRPRPTESSDDDAADSEEGPFKKLKSEKANDNMSHTQRGANSSNMAKNEDEVRLITDQLLELTAAEERLLWMQTKYIKEGGTDAVEFISRAVDFLKDFEAILSFWLDGVIPPEAAFQHLFQTYAAIFRIPFRPGSTLGKRSTPIFGTAVKCVPDLLYTECFLDKEARATHAQCNCVVTVAGVTRGDKQSSRKGTTPPSAQNSSCSKGKSRTTCTSPTADIPLPDGVRGQHAIQLLTEAPLALPDQYDPQRKSMLGLIVQATKIRLTYFEIGRDHLSLMQQGTVPSNLGGNTATVRYSQAYDMFVKDDRKDLVHMMMGLAAIGNNHRKTPFFQYLM